MKQVLKKIAIVSFVVVVVGIGALVALVELTARLEHPATPLPAILASDDPAVIARGEYLVHAVAHCSSCHGPKDVVAARRLDPAAPLVGGFSWDIMPFGVFTAANLTPHESGIGRMSDGALARAVRHGVDADGTIAPMMRLAVGPMSDEDLTAVVSWLRKQAPVEGAHPQDELGFLAKVVSRNLGPRLEPPPAHVPEGGISLERGRYLAEGPAMCAGCHTPRDPMNGFSPTGPLFSGEPEPDPDPTDETMVIFAPNLTPDPKTGHIASWTEETFVARFKGGPVFPGSKMPWAAFALLHEDDVRSIYRYLKSLPPAVNEIGPTRRPK